MPPAPQGGFTVYVQQLSQMSNGWPLAVGSALSNGGSGGNTPNLAISIAPNPVPNSGGGSWSYSVTITETGGAPVTLIGLNVGENDYSSSLPLDQVVLRKRRPCAGCTVGSLALCISHGLERRSPCTGGPQRLAPVGPRISTTVWIQRILVCCYGNFCMLPHHSSGLDMRARASYTATSRRSAARFPTGLRLGGDDRRRNCASASKPPMQWSPHLRPASWPAALALAAQGCCARGSPPRRSGC